MKTTEPKNSMKSKIHLICAMLGIFVALSTPTSRADTFGSGGNTFTIDFVNVGNAVNANDSGTTGIYSSPYGGVAYNF